MTGLINTLESPGEFDALTTLRQGEPYFLLVGRDKLAPPLVQKWADDNRERALADYSARRIDKEQLETELRKSSDAEEIGWAMQAYKAGHAVEVAASKTTYTGHEQTEEQKRKDRLSRQRAAAVSALHNAVAELNDLVPLLTLNGEEREGLGILLDDMRDLAAELTPARPGIRSKAKAA